MDKAANAKDYNDWPKDEKWSKDIILRDARKQSEISTDIKTKIEWHIPSQEKSELVKSVLRDEGVRYIKVVHTPKV